jgi:hypothetical protein
VTPPLSPGPRPVPCLGHLQSTHAALQRHVTQIDNIQAQIRTAAGTTTHTFFVRALEGVCLYARHLVAFFEGFESAVSEEKFVSLSSYPRHFLDPLSPVLSSLCL